MSKSGFDANRLRVLAIFFSQDAQPSQLPSRGNSFENSSFQNNTNEQGSTDNNYAGGYNRGGVPPSQQQQSQPSSSQAYRPPHMQNRMNLPK